MTHNKLQFLLVLLLLLKPTFQDVYMHNPRGSNNRLNENTVQRTNNNRIFDSQNNNRGGYNTGDAGSTAAGNNEAAQYSMRYFQSGLRGGSYLNVEFTAQHGCGGLNGQINKDCNIVLQYMTQPADNFGPTDMDRLRDGTNTDSQDYNRMGQNTVEVTQAAYLERKGKSVKADRAIHEPWEHYDACYYRERNLGLFRADQNLKTNEKGYSSAIYTRQNPNGGRSGYECPEERDYYPYWHPNGGWRDIAVLTSKLEDCAYYKAESFNVKPKGQCIEYYPNEVQKHWSRWNNRVSCNQNGGRWIELWNYLDKMRNLTTQEACESANMAPLELKWGVPFDSKDVKVSECLVLLNEPSCGPSIWSRQNHLGNARDGKPPTYQWRLPYFPSRTLQRAVFRIRYNISTTDFEDDIDASSNGAASPIKNNPTVKVGPVSLRLAINTAQVGRVFEDRSHVFYLMPRPPMIIQDNVNVQNLNVRGKRGNVVQTFPAVEYDFVPNELRVNANTDLVHMQWTGSNTHNNNGAGDAGQGKGGSDRSNFVLLSDMNENYPLNYDESYFWSEIDFLGFVNGAQNITSQTQNYIIRNRNAADPKKDLANYLASSSYYQCQTAAECTRSLTLPNGQQRTLDADLNDAPASVPGAIVRFKVSNATYNYMSSRNNAFSNRNQIGYIRVL